MHLRITRQRRQVLKDEIPELATRPQPKQADRSAKPGRFSSRLSHLPFLIRWTRYGCWTDDGSAVLNQHGQVIYEKKQGLIALALGFGHPFLQGDEKPTVQRKDNPDRPRGTWTGPAIPKTSRARTLSKTRQSTPKEATRGHGRSARSAANWARWPEVPPNQPQVVDLSQLPLQPVSECSGSSPRTWPLEQGRRGNRHTPEGRSRPSHPLPLPQGRSHTPDA